MLIYRDGRFFAGKSSFALPNGCKINDAPLATFPNGINLLSEDGAYTIDVNFEFGLGGAQRSLEDSLILGDFSKTKVKSRSYSFGTGWYAEYHGDLYSYLEIRFDAPTGLLDSTGHEINIFRVVVTAPRNAVMRTIRHSLVMSGLLDNFHP